ncbi:MAG: DEAD/DEAH box helicase [Acidimicrobiales bacterium]
MTAESAFVQSLGFEPDRFQLDAFAAFDEGAHVIVAAPTGAGKTLVASYAIDQLLRRGRRVFYTTPIKALSNQKFRDLIGTYGLDRVGLLTGDNAINGDAPVVVMTTEVLRNMLYAGRRLDSLGAVILDEVHYLQDSYRGPVWEEVIIHLPRDIQLVALSATVSNADELAEWMETVRGTTRLVVETRRPVELENLYLVGERASAKLHLIKTLSQGKPNAKGFRYDPEIQRGRNRKGPKGPKGRTRPKWQTPRRVDVIQLLRERELLPVIYFLFSRAACSEAALSVLDAGITLTTSEERERIRQIAAERMANLSDTDRAVLGYDRFLQALEAGVAAHHAGMVPPMKEVVETCFERGMVKAVFATETLALGINMPARTVVIEKLTKWNGDGHEFLSPAQYTQLTGRAGRRGIDDFGDAVVLWSPWVRFEQVATLAASRDYVLRSAFRPTYNMAANLVRRYDPERARQLLNLSFAQFRADADVVRGEYQLEKLRDRYAQIEGRIEREFGPIGELRAALATESEIEADPDEIAFALSQLRPGNALEVVAADLPSPVVVMAVAYRKGGRVKVLVADTETNSYEMTAPMLERVPVHLGDVAVPDPYLPNSVSFVYEIGQALATANFRASKRRSLGPTTIYTSDADVPAGARKGLRRLDKLDAEMASMRTGVNSAAESLGLQFDRVIELLTERGHLDGWSLTASGERLARMYHELDLLVVEAIEAGLFDGLAPSEVAALASTFIFEERRSHDVPEPWFPTDELRRRFGKLTRLHRTLANHEHRLRLNETRVPDAGFMAVAHSWAAGGHLDQVLDDEELTAGDFVRTARLLIDLLRQIAQLAIDPATQRAARAASDAVHRDLVAVSSAIDLDGDELDDDGLDLDGLEDDGLDDVGLDQDGLDRASDS